MLQFAPEVFRNQFTLLNLGVSFWDVAFFWASQVGFLALLAVAGSFIYNSIKFGNPVRGFMSTAEGFFGGIYDVLMLPFGIFRVFAMAGLTIREAIRRRILYLFILFFIPFLFAGWYLPNGKEGQLVFLMALVSNVITWILLPMVLFMTAMTIPNDIKNRTIQTIVTKPIRRSEVLFGRVLGYIVIFTAVLVVMSGVSLIYLSRQIDPQVKEKQWTARVPIYPKIDEKDINITKPLIFYKNGSPREYGTNVGKEWSVRSHIEGTDTAHWFFIVDPESFKNRKTVRVEFKFDIFKTTKGDPTREGAEGSGVLAHIQFKDRVADKIVFSKYHRVDNHRVNAIDEVPAELFSNGRVEVIVQCITPDQFLGMATSDLYFLDRSEAFEWNFIKGMFSIWLRIVLVITLCVTCSTVLNGFVTVLVTVAFYIIALNFDFLVQLVTPDMSVRLPGGGPIESFIRIITQNNQVNLLDPTLPNKIAQFIDNQFLFVLERLVYIVPNLSNLDSTDLVAHGYNIPEILVRNNVIEVAAYVVPILIAGCFALRSREIAA